MPKEGRGWLADAAKNLYPSYVIAATVLGIHARSQDKGGDEEGQTHVMEWVGCRAPLGCPSLLKQTLGIGFAWPGSLGSLWGRREFRGSRQNMLHSRKRVIQSAKHVFLEEARKVSRCYTAWWPIKIQHWPLHVASIENTGAPGLDLDTPLLVTHYEEAIYSAIAIVSQGSGGPKWG
ncbi:hypothetical protein LZ31DRAFT_56617 [Colletotrichum somersetense]|nr:hypothetical protein LZ31DRAFT_56617 [Colletotrichum somersetense]